MQVEQGFRRQLQGYRMTTAEILYHLPDHPAVLQSYVWQSLDMAPRFPELHRFPDFWSREIEGRLHSVRVGAVELITAGVAGRALPELTGLLASQRSSHRPSTADATNRAAASAIWAKLAKRAPEPARANTTVCGK